MNSCLSAGFQPLEKMGIGIAAQQKDLKKQQTGGPDRRRPAKPRKQVFADDRLDHEEQKGAQKHGRVKYDGIFQKSPCGYGMNFRSVVWRVPQVVCEFNAFLPAQPF